MNNFKSFKRSLKKIVFPKYFEKNYRFFNELMTFEQIFLNYQIFLKFFFIELTILLNDRSVRNRIDELSNIVCVYTSQLVQPA